MNSSIFVHMANTSRGSKDESHQKWEGRKGHISRGLAPSVTLAEMACLAKVLSSVAPVRVAVQAAAAAGSAISASHYSAVAPTRKGIASPRLANHWRFRHRQ